MTFVSAIPVLASLDIERSVAFYEEGLGFSRILCEKGVHGIASSGAVPLHFRACQDPAIPRAASCRLRVDDIEAAHARCQVLGIVHPQAPLETKPWGNREFGALDGDGNLLTFFWSP